MFNGFRSAKISVGFESGFKSRARHESESQISMKAKKVDPSNGAFGRKYKPIVLEVQSAAICFFRCVGFGLSYLAIVGANEYTCQDHDVDVRSIAKLVNVALLVNSLSVSVEAVHGFFNYSTYYDDYREWPQYLFCIFSGLVSPVISAYYIYTLLEYTGCTTNLNMFSWLVFVGSMCSSVQFCCCILKQITDSDLLVMHFPAFLSMGAHRKSISRRDVITWVTIFIIVAELSQLKYVIDNVHCILMAESDDAYTLLGGVKVPLLSVSEYSNIPIKANLYYVSLSFFGGSFALLLAVIFYRRCLLLSTKTLAATRPAAGVGNKLKFWVSLMPTETAVICLVAANLFLLVGFGPGKIMHNLGFYLRVKGILWIISAAVVSIMYSRSLIAEYTSLLDENNAKKSFISYISHEIRGPVANTQLGLDLMLTSLQGPTAEQMTKDEIVDILKDLRVTTEVAHNTLNDILLFDKIKSNLFTVDIETHRAMKFVMGTIKPFRIQAQAQNIRLSCATKGTDLKKLRLRIDPHKMTQVIRNLLSNALKFTPSGGSIVIQISKQPLFSNGTSPVITDVDYRGVLRVAVVDSGAGISVENLPKLFGQYVQFDANKLQGGKGSGLGLWLSKIIVEMHGGLVSALFHILPRFVILVFE
jgi:signal transduction histidine kinase